jgi:kojibiose phosphorylase
MKLRDNLFSDTGWDIQEREFDSDQLILNGSNYMTGNGYLGYRGTFPEWTKDEYVGCVVTDTWDNADGKWQELCTVPNGLFLEITAIGEDGRRRRLSLLEGPTDSYLRELNFRYGLHTRVVDWSPFENGPSLNVTDRRFASYRNIHLVPATCIIAAGGAVELEVNAGIDGELWSLHGEHFSSYEPEADGDELLVHTRTQERGTDVFVAHALRAVEIEPGESELLRTEKGIYRRYRFSLPAESILTLETVMGVFTSNDVEDPRSEVLSAVRSASSEGYAQLFDSHKAEWDKKWAKSEIEIEGDEMAQTLIRYNMYQNFIATPSHTDDLPIGARGLSCQAYQGGAFWDQEVFNVPMYLYTAPELARRVLVYRHKTIEGARKKARDLGYRGAFYAWVSGDTGEEICPSYFFVDVLSGRPIRNHFNDWQIHISPDISYAIWQYFVTTDDFGFLLNHGAEVLFEIARFLYSHAYYKKDKGRYEFIRLLGPDEYHENVDNNGFTNFQAQFACSVAVEVYRMMRERAPAALVDLERRLELSEQEVSQWEEMAAEIFVREPDPNSRIIEQFDGFFELEDIGPKELAGRLKDKGEYWGWPNGIAVSTQVSKQADVVQLFALHPRAYDKETMTANFDYYEPRTQHGSSLSHSVYAMVASWIGKMDYAYRYFLQSCTVDLYNTGKAVSGGTFIGGIHTAACGVAWQIVVRGFGGLVTTADGVELRPHLPEEWSRVSFPLVWHGRRMRVDISHGEIALSADEENDEAVPLRLFGQELSLEPGAGGRFSL